LRFNDRLDLTRSAGGDYKGPRLLNAKLTESRRLPYNEQPCVVRRDIPLSERTRRWQGSTFPTTSTDRD
jgi:hypothetical protein